MTTRMITALYLKVGMDVYSGLASEVKVPGVEATVWGGSTDTNMVADVPVGQRKVTITARQDWEDLSGLCEYLATHEGESVEIIYAANPQATTPAYFKVTATCSAPDQGGAVNAFGEFTISLPCTKPIRTAAPA